MDLESKDGTLYSGLEDDIGLPSVRTPRKSPSDHTINDLMKVFVEMNQKEFELRKLEI